MLVGKSYISAIPTSLHQFMSITIGFVRFIDSFQIMKESLSTLIDNSYDKIDKYVDFNHIKKLYNDHLHE